MPKGIRDLYRRYRLMRMFPGLNHPDQVREWPAEFIDWAFQFAAVETEASAARAEQAGG